LPILSEVGTDRKDTISRINRYIREFEMYGASAISDIPAKNRNVKLNMVTEAFFHNGNPNHNIQDATYYGRVDKPQFPTLHRVLDILKIPEAREIYGLTFSDLINLDISELNRINDDVLELYKQRLDMQKKEEKKYHEK